MEGPNTGACLVCDGALVAMAEEERFTRQKTASKAFPSQSIAFCLDFAGLPLRDVDVIACGWDHDKYPSKIESHMRSIPGRQLDPYADSIEGLVHGELSPDLAKFKIRLACKKLDPAANPTIKWYPHHLCHVASVHYLSGFEESAVLVMDGSGEEVSTSTWQCHGEQIDLIDEWPLPDSLGWFYGAITEWLGFKAYSGEGKVMGLAAYGEPDGRIEAVLSDFCQLDPKQIYRVDPTYVYYGTRTHARNFTDKLVAGLGTPRLPGAELTAEHASVAYEAQRRLETTAAMLARDLLNKTTSGNLCISGGVAMNCKMNGVLSSLDEVEDVFVNPASHDSGTALGAALLATRAEGLDPRRTVMSHAYWGPSFGDDEIELALEHCQLRYKRCDDIVTATAELLAENKIVGWFQGRAEVGARALGARSILANPMDLGMKDRINERVKYREAFRPFAPSLPFEVMDEYLDQTKASPFMILACAIKEKYRDIFPSVVHVDGSVRPQTVEKTTSPQFWNLLQKFGELSGHPVLLNTSFNVRGEPIVGTPLDAVRCFFGNGMDALAIGPYLVTK